MNFLSETGIVVERLAKCRAILVSKINIEGDNFYVKWYLYEKLECENFASLVGFSFLGQLFRGSEILKAM